MLTVFALPYVPPMVQGLVRDMRVRWALEEAGRPYRTRLVDAQAQGSPDYRAVQPFGQVPAIADETGTLFESGAIVLEIAEGSPALMPADPLQRRRTRAWMFAAINSIEPAIDPLSTIDFFESKQAWAVARRPAVVEELKVRLGELAGVLDGREHIVGPFTAADLLMTCVLENLRHTDLVSGDPVLGPYVARCKARPAYGRALDAHLRPFREAEAAGA